MSLLIVDRMYSVKTDMKQYVTESFLRHVEHGNKLLFTAVTTDVGYRDNEEVLHFLCIGCGYTIEYRIARHFIDGGLIKMLNGTFFGPNGGVAVEVSWKLVGKDCSIAHLMEYQKSSRDIVEKLLNAHANPNRLFKRGLTKIF